MEKHSRQLFTAVKYIVIIFDSVWTLLQVVKTDFYSNVKLQTHFMREHNQSFYEYVTTE